MPITPPLRIVDCIPTGARYEGRQVVDQAGQHVSLEELVRLANQRTAGQGEPVWGAGCGVDDD